MKISNVINFRDQGGLVCADGRKIKKGMLFRSGALNLLTDAECRYLTALNLRAVLDYRDKEEAANSPDRLFGDVSYFNVPANPSSSGETATLDRADRLFDNNPHVFMTRLYEQLPFNNTAYHQLIALLKKEDNAPLLQHCAVGKDRTGVGCVITLALLGATGAVIMDDYLESEKRISPVRSQIIDYLLPNATPAQYKKAVEFLSVKESYLMAAINAIVEKYQTLDKWLEEEYLVTSAVRATIRSKYLDD